MVAGDGGEVKDGVSACVHLHNQGLYNVFYKMKQVINRLLGCELGI